MSKETFVHKGIEYRVVKANPPFGKLKPGMWLRICYGPYEGKEDVLTEVITCDGKDLKVQRHGDSITGVGSYYDFDAYFEVVMKTEEDYLPEEEAKYWAETEPLPVPVSVTDHIPSSTWPEINETSGGERTADLLTATWPSGATGRANPSNIVVCFDGTWNQNEKENTNVHRLIGFPQGSPCSKSMIINRPNRTLESQKLIIIQSIDLQRKCCTMILLFRCLTS